MESKQPCVCDTMGWICSFLVRCVLEIRLCKLKNKILNWIEFFESKKISSCQEKKSSDSRLKHTKKWSPVGWAKRDRFSLALFTGRIRICCERRVSCDYSSNNNKYKIVTRAQTASSSQTIFGYIACVCLCVEKSNDNDASNTLAIIWGKK